MNISSQLSTRLPIYRHNIEITLGLFIKKFKKWDWSQTDLTLFRNLLFYYDDQKERWEKKVEGDVIPLQSAWKSMVVTGFHISSRVQRSRCRERAWLVVNSWFLPVSQSDEMISKILPTPDHSVPATTSFAFLGLQSNPRIENERYNRVEPRSSETSVAYTVGNTVPVLVNRKRTYAPEQNGF